jgi:hypothetical protein
MASFSASRPVVSISRAIREVIERIIPSEYLVKNAPQNQLNDLSYYSDRYIILRDKLSKGKAI